MEAFQANFWQLFAVSLNILKETFIHYILLELLFHAKLNDLCPILKYL